MNTESAVTYEELVYTVRRSLVLADRALGWRERLRRNEAIAAAVNTTRGFGFTPPDSPLMQKIEAVGKERNP